MEATKALLAPSFELLATVPLRQSIRQRHSNEEARVAVDIHRRERATWRSGATQASLQVGTQPSLVEDAL